MKISFDLIYPFLVVLARFGPAIVLLPGFRGKFLPGNQRTFVALLFTILLAPLLRNQIGPPPLVTGLFILTLAQEVFVGVFVGLLIQVLFLTLDVCGQVLSFQMGFSAAQALNPTSAEQSALISGFLSIFGLAFFFTTDLYVLMIKALVSSYELIPLFSTLNFGDIFELLLRFIQQSFSFAVVLSIPMLLIITLFFVGVGLVSKFIPGVQIFFISLPIQVILGLFVLLFSFKGLLSLYLQFTESQLEKIISLEM
tara:strand:+ start:10 stop:771 length:762 start_codon:yes stop_codon:yes gene_type:complete